LLSAKISKKIHADIDSAIKIGLLHDFCLVERLNMKDDEESYLYYHPKEAVVNSKIFGLSEKETNAILSHMFPLSKMPTSRVGWSVTLADKIVATYKTLYGTVEAMHYIRRIYNKTIMYFSS